MHKLLLPTTALTLLATIATNILVVVPLHASERILDNTMTLITGKVTQIGTTKGISGATIAVTCNGHQSGDITTSVSGVYATTFSRADCPSGSPVHAVATHNSTTGNSHSTVDDYASLDLNIGLVNIANVPELGVIGGLGALLAGAGALYYVHSRQQHAES